MADPISDLQKYWRPSDSGSSTDSLVRGIQAFEEPRRQAIPTEAGALTRFGRAVTSAGDTATTKAASLFNPDQLEPSQVDPAGLQLRRQQEAEDQARIESLRTEWGTDEAGVVKRGLMDLAGGAAGAFGGTAEWIGKRGGLKWLEKIGHDSQLQAAAMQPKEPNIVDDVISGVGSTVMFFGPGVGASALTLKGANALLSIGKAGVPAALKLAKAEPWIASTVAAALESAGVAQQAYDQGMSEHGNEELANTRAFWAGVASMPIVLLGDKLGIFGNANTVSKHVLNTFLSEGVQEYGQQIAQNVASFRPAGEGATYAGIVGGLAGGAVGTVQAAAGWHARNKADPNGTGNDVLLDYSRPVAAEDVIKAAEVNVNARTAVELKMANMNAGDRQMFIEKLTQNGHGDLVAQMDREAQIPEFLQNGAAIEKELGLAYRRIDDAIERYLQPGSTQDLAGAMQPDEAPGVTEAPGGTVDTAADKLIAARPDLAPDVEQAPQMPASVEKRVAPAANQAELLEFAYQELEKDTGQPIARDSIKIGSPTPELAMVAAAAKSAFGTDILYVNSNGIRFVEGGQLQKRAFLGKSLKGRNAIIVNLSRGDSKTTIRNTIGHELTHQMEVQFPGIFKDLQAAALAHIATGKAQTFRSWLSSELQAEHAAAQQELTPEQFKAQLEAEYGAEIPAEVVGEMLDDAGFWSAVLQNRPQGTFAEKVVSTVKGLLNRLQRALISAGFVRGVKDINAMRTAVDTAFRQWEQANQAKEFEATQKKEQVAGRQAFAEKLGQELAKPTAPQRAAEAYKKVAERTFPATKTTKQVIEKVTGVKRPKPIKPVGAGFQREQLIEKIVNENYQPTERDLRKHPSVGKVYNKFQDLRRKVEALKDKFDKKVVEVAALAGGNAKLVDVKPTSSAIHKIWTDYGGDVTRIKDMLRATILLPDTHMSFPEINGLIRTRFQGVILKRNGWLPDAKPSPEGYRDILFNVRVDGVMAEIQVNTPAMVEAKQKTAHKLYQVIRAVERKQKIGQEPTLAERFKVAGATIAQKRIYAEATKESLKRFRQPISLKFQRATDERGEIQIGPPSRLKNGLYFGAPNGKATEQEVNDLARRIFDRAYDDPVLFERSAFWYEKAGNMIRQLSNGDPKLMEDMTRIVAYMSADASLGTNVAAAVQSAYHIATGTEFTKGYGRYHELGRTNAAHLNRVMKADKFDLRLPGVSDKVMSFYRNLHDPVFQRNDWPQESTLDKWMHRIFGYKRLAESFSDTQYQFGREVLIRAARIANEELGRTDILPRHIQAAAWVRERGQDVAEFSDYVERRSAMIPWEFRSDQVAPDYNAWTADVRQQFDREARELLIAPDGRSRILEMLGTFPLQANIPGRGVWEGVISPNTMTMVVLPGGSSKDIDPSPGRVAGLITGHALWQDAVAWYVPKHDALKQSTYPGIEVAIDVGKIDTEAFSKHLGNPPMSEFTMPDGRQAFHLVYFRNEKFEKPTQAEQRKWESETLAKIAEYDDPNVLATTKTFRAQGDLEFAGENGEGYLQGIREAGRPDLLDGANRLREQYKAIADRARAANGIAAAGQAGTAAAATETTAAAEAGVSPAAQATEAGPAAGVAQQPAWLAQRAAENGFTSVDEWLRQQPDQFMAAAEQWRSEHPTGFQRQYAPRNEGEELKAYMKRAIDTMPQPESIPFAPRQLFDMSDPRTQLIPIGDLVSSKTDEENAKGGTNAPKRFMATIDGVLSPRGPIDVEQRADGKYLITDGNGTYTALKRYGWPAIPAIVHTAEATGFQRVQDIPVAQLEYENVPYLKRRAMAAGYVDVQEWHRAQPEAFRRAVRDAIETPPQLSMFQRQEPASVQMTVASIPELTFAIETLLDTKDAGITGLKISKGGVLTGPVRELQDLSEKLKSDYGDLGIESTAATRKSMLAAAARIDRAIGVKQYEAPNLTPEQRQQQTDAIRADLKRGYMDMGLSEADAEAQAQDDLSSRFQRPQPTEGERFTIPAETRMQVAQRLIQDREARLAVVQEAVRKGGGAIDEATNIVRAAELYPKIIGNKVDLFKRIQVEPLMREIGRSNVDLHDIELYMYASHAKEANAYIATINPAMPDGGSGMLDEQADQALAALRADPDFAKIQAFADRLWAITEQTRRIQLNGGLITPTIYAGWKGRYQHYIPLKGFANVDEAGRTTGTGIGARGFDVRGLESRRRYGRSTLAGNIVANIIGDHERALARTELNKVAKVVGNFVLANPDPRLWEVNKIKMLPQFYKSGQLDENGLAEGEVRYLHSINMDPDSTIVYKHHGQAYAIWIKDKGMLQALKGPGGMMSMTSEEVKAATRAWMGINRFLAKMWTGWNPVFTTTNFARDFLTGMIHATNVGGGKYAFKTFTDIAAAGKGIWDVELRGKADSPWAKLYQQYKEDGGKTGFYMWSDLESRQREIQNLIDRASTATTSREVFNRSRDAIHKIEETVMDVNGVVENAIRLSAYKNALTPTNQGGLGMSRAEAAQLAGNLTVNFNKKGELTPKLASLFLFFNPSVQGPARIVQAARNNPKSFATAVGGLVALGILAGMLAGEDRDEEGVPYWDRVPDYEKARSLVFMTGDGNRITIPLPYGYGFFVSLGYGISDLVRNRPVGAVALDQLKAFGQHYNPLGTSDNLVTMLSPTVLDPWVEMAMNEKATGLPLMPDEQSITGMPIPASERYWSTSRGTPLQQFTSWLNEATGGTKVQPGALSISPEVIKNFSSYYLGGAGNFITDGVQSAMLMSDFGGQAAMESNKIPFLRQWYKFDNTQDDSRFYNESKQKALASLEEAKKYYNTDRPAVLERLNKERGLAQLGASVSAVDRAMRSLRLREISIIEDATLTAKEKFDARKEIDREREDLLQQWNKSFYEAELESRK